MNKAFELVNSKHIPKDFKREFDVHIYFESTTRDIALNLQLKLKNTFDPSILFVGHLIDQPIGPHLLPMFECNFEEKDFQQIVLWLMKEREELSILIHPLTGNDYLDHTKYAIWLGKQLDLKLESLK